jgi:hypothetical protein
MSEGILGNNDRQHYSFDNYKAENQQQAEQTVNSAGSTSSSPATPRAGAFLVEAYGKLVGKQRNTVSPNKVLFEYSKFLVSFSIPKF